MNRAAVEVSAGSVLVIDGAEWRVERGEPHTGRVHLVGVDGARQCVTFRFLAHHPDCRTSSVTAAGSPRALATWHPAGQELVKLRYAHLQEVRTGFRSGDRLRPGRGEPRAQYDPDLTTLTGRRLTKAAELAAMGGEEARLLAGLWYDGPALKPYKGERSTRGGQRQGQWIIHREPRDRRTVFFQDPGTHQWHSLRWTGLPADDTVPAFGDKRVAELLRTVKAAGLRPRTDRELLPELLALMNKARPVSQWAGQLTKSERVEIAREREQALAAAADRPSPPAVPVQPARPAPGRGDRRRQREEAASEPLARPPRLGAGTRRRDLFLLPADGTQDDNQ